MAIAIIASLAWLPHRALEEKEDQQLLEEMAAPQYLQLPTDVSLDFVDNQQDLDKVWKSLQSERFIGFDW